jgi:CheY-like chemotaxis protein
MTPSLAAKFTASRALQAGPGILFLVSDNGPGIPPNMVRRIFDPYVSTKSAGRGLGLAIVASIVASHGGGISIRSSSISGTTFSIFLPNSKIPADAANSETAPDKDIGGDVLVIDDDNSILATTSILLKTLKLEPHTASNPDSALTEFRRFSAKLSCVILDAHLGHFDSVWLLRSLRIADPHVPVIVTSGSTAEETAEMFKSQPYNGFLSKPYTRAELQAAIASV